MPILARLDAPGVLYHELFAVLNAERPKRGQDQKGDRYLVLSLVPSPMTRRVIIRKPLTEWGTVINI